MSTMPAANYEDARAYLGNKSDRPYRGEKTTYNGRVRQTSPRATRVIASENGVAVRYHNTNVITYRPDGIELNTGSWYSKTTKDRFNEALSGLDSLVRVSVYQDRGIWYMVGRHRNPDEIRDPDGDHPYWIQDYKITYFDGVIVGYDGTLINAPTPDADSDNTGEIKRRAKLIKAFTTELKRQLETGTLPAPSGGDCWYCAMKTESGESLGDSTGNTDHLLSHIEESYIVPSLILSVVKARGSQAMLWGLADIWGKLPDGGSRQGGSFYRGIAVRDVPRMVARYLKIRLGVAS